MGARAASPGAVIVMPAGPTGAVIMLPPTTVLLTTVLMVLPPTMGGGTIGTIEWRRRHRQREVE